MNIVLYYYYFFTKKLAENQKSLVKILYPEQNHELKKDSIFLQMQAVNMPYEL